MAEPRNGGSEKAAAATKICIKKQTGADA